MEVGVLVELFVIVVAIVVLGVCSRSWASSSAVSARSSLTTLDHLVAEASMRC